jgi:hypothetical protein
MTLTDLLVLIGIPTVLFGVPILLLVANDALRRQHGGYVQKRTRWEVIGPIFGGAFLAGVVYGIALGGFGREAVEITRLAIIVATFPAPR